MVHEKRVRNWHMPVVSSEADVPCPSEYNRKLFDKAANFAISNQLRFLYSPFYLKHDNRFLQYLTGLTGRILWKYTGNNPMIRINY